ncbi:MAG: transporter substrate-binding domain-containing protein [Tannerella sp.]|jgi:membrane-bound lytic murein transglycosylase MltF|nr:transporter substrate-binding domain-containing protein [Tannerella sp.]
MFTGKLLKTYIFLLLAVICLMAVLIYFKSVATPVRDYREIRREGILRIVTEYGQAGYYVSDDSQIEGFQYALCREIARQADMEVLMYLEMSLEKSFSGLSAGQYDIIARNIPVTSKLKEKYLFLEPVVLDRQALVQRTAAANRGAEPIRNQLHLAHRTLHVPEASPAILRLDNLRSEIGDTIFIVEDPLYSSEQLCIMVARGDIDFAVCDRQIAQLSKKQFPELDIETDISFTQLQSWVVRKDAPVLADSLNRWLQKIRDSGAYDRIREQYYSDLKPANQ